MKYKAINFEDKFSKFSEHQTPKVIAELNAYPFKLAKIKDEFLWHTYEDTLELL